MKTNHKLLVGLVIALFLMATVFLGVVKYYHITTANETGQTSEQEAAKLSFQQETSSKASTLYFPMALLQPPLQLR